MKIETGDFTNFLAAGGQLSPQDWDKLSDEDKTRASVIGITLRMRENHRVVEYLISAIDHLIGEGNTESSLDIIASKLQREHPPTVPTS